MPTELTQREQVFSWKFIRRELYFTNGNGVDKYLKMSPAEADLKFATILEKYQLTCADLIEQLQLNRWAQARIEQQNHCRKQQPTEAFGMLVV